MYAERKGWGLYSVEVRLSNNRIHAKDCEDCETKAGMLDQTGNEIRLEGNLDVAQPKRLLEIATRCPVHRTLSSEIKIRTTEAQETLPAKTDGKTGEVGLNRISFIMALSIGTRVEIAYA